MTFLLESVVRSSIVLAAGLAAVALLKRQPAALRHSVLAAAIALAAAQPLLNLAVPAMPINVIDVMADTAAASAPLSINVAVVTDGYTQTSGEPIDWPQLVMTIWIAGAAIGLAVLVAGLAWLFRLQSRSRRGGSDWQSIDPDAHIMITPHPALIVTWGALVPTVLLPSTADAWSVDRKRLVIAHEKAHMMRQDWLVQLLAEVARAVYWFNPLFWIACSRLRRESEYAADDAVLESGVAGTSYASHLVDLARALSIHGRTWLPAPSIARPSTLERRVRAMLNPRLNRRPVSTSLRAVAIALLCAMAVSVAAASQSANSPNGVVTDAMGKPLVDAVLRLSPSMGGEAVEARSDASGNFQFPPVAAGEYMLSIRYPGFSSSRQLLQLNGGGATINLRAQVGTLRETITVDGTSSGRASNQALSFTPPACQPSPVGGQLIPPMKLRDVRPAYKQEWRDAGVAGEVLMRATIGKDGRVRGIDVISPVNAELEDEAMAAVSQWLFSPTYLNCEPVEVQMYVSVSFKRPQ